MKLTDKDIVEALMSGKMIRIDSCPSRKAKLVNGCLEYCDNGRAVSVGIDLLERNDFEIVEQEIDWDKVIKGKYLCKLWNHPDDVKYFGYLMKFENKYKTCIAGCIRYFKHCRPLRADEIKLVMDEKELWK